MDFLRALASAAFLGGIVYLGVYVLDEAAWSHVFDVGTGSMWATVTGGTAFAFTFVNEFFLGGEVGGGFHKGY